MFLGLWKKGKQQNKSNLKYFRLTLSLFMHILLQLCKALLVAVHLLRKCHTYKPYGKTDGQGSSNNPPQQFVCVGYNNKSQISAGLFIGYQAGS